MTILQIGICSNISEISLYLLDMLNPRWHYVRMLAGRLRFSPTGVTCSDKSKRDQRKDVEAFRKIESFVFCSVYGLSSHRMTYGKKKRSYGVFLRLAVKSMEKFESSRGLW